MSQPGLKRMSFGRHWPISGGAENRSGPGNGRLGCLAAGFLDLMATVEQPVTGYGLNYQYGLVSCQWFSGGQQQASDNWQPKSYPLVPLQRCGGGECGNR